MIFQKLLRQITRFKTKREKVRDFRKYRRGEEFFVDFYDSYNSAKMVSSILVKVGDRVILTDRGSIITYRVVEVEYLAA